MRKNAMNAITRKGATKVTVNADYIKAATTLPVYWKAYEPWMLEVETAIAEGKPVSAEDLGYMCELAAPRMTPEQSTLRTEVAAVNGKRKAA